MNAGLKRIFILIFGDSELLDIAGADRVFHSAAGSMVHSSTSDGLLYSVDLFSPDGGLIRTCQDIRVETLPMRELAPGDCDTIIIVAGGRDAARRDPWAIDWLRRNHTKARRTSSICAGAFALAEAGILDGRRAATHWMDCEELQAGYPAVSVDRASLFVEDRGVWTAAAGMTAGIDMALAMVEEDHGYELAQLVARGLSVFPRPAKGWQESSDEEDGDPTEGPMKRPIAVLLRWIVDHPGDDLRAERLAERAHMSLRNFYRAFEHATGESPGEWVEALRVEIAKRLLQYTSRGIEQIAWEAGFATYQRMRRAFLRRIGTAPGDYRARLPPPHLGRSCKAGPATQSLRSLGTDGSFYGEQDRCRLAGWQ